jgi:hypothetical protein
MLVPPAKLNTNALDFPQKFVGIEIAPLGIPARVLTLESFNDICEVPLPPSSTAIDWPEVVPARLIGPEALSVITYSLCKFHSLFLLMPHSVNFFF